MFLKTKTNSITKDYLNKKRDGYRDTIQKGLDAMNYRIISETGSREDNIKRLKNMGYDTTELKSWDRIYKNISKVLNNVEE